MVRKLKKFFDQINYEAGPSFDNLSNVELEKGEKLVTIKLSAKQSIDAVDAILLDSRNRSAKLPLPIKIKYAFETEPEVDYVKSVLIYALTLVGLDKVANALNQDLIRVDEKTIAIELGAQFLIDEFKVNEKEIVNILEGFGIKQGITLELNSAILDEAASKLHERIVSAQTETNKPVQSKERATTGTRSTKNYKQMTISEIVESQATKKMIFVECQVFQIEIATPKGHTIYTFGITDFNHAIRATHFWRENSGVDVSKIRKNDYVRFYGDIILYNNEQKIDIKSFEVINSLNPFLRTDTAPKKRIEFHTHSKMSVMDGVSSVKDYIDQASKWGHAGIAITDHNSVQAYPDAFAASKMLTHPFKVVYGTELNYYDKNDVNIISKPVDIPFPEAIFTFFDLETTSLKPNQGEIIEFAAVKTKNGIELDRLQFLVKAKQKLSKFTTSLTHITDEMLQKDGIEISDALKRIKAFFGDTIAVAHNAYFDMGWLDYHFEKHGMPALTNPFVDSVRLSWLANPSNKSHRLEYISKQYEEFYDDSVAHRADFDTDVLNKVFHKMLRVVDPEMTINLKKLNDFELKIKDNVFYRHLTVFAKNQKGLKAIFKLVSHAHTVTYNSRRKTPLIPFEEIAKYRADLIISSCCYMSDAFAESDKSERYFLETIKKFDVIEIQPPMCYEHLINNEFTRMDLQNSIKTVIKWSQKVAKTIIATSDTHYVNPHEKISRTILAYSKGVGGSLHPMYNSRTKSATVPDSHLRTTNEMIEEFSFLEDRKLVEDIVIENTHKLLAQFENNTPIHDKLYTPKIPNAEEQVFKIAKEKLDRIYGPNPHEDVLKIYQKEYKAIVKHGFAVVYLIALKVVQKSYSEGFIVGSRGSVGSSFIAFLTGITEVNPLPPHYVCHKCHHFEFSKNVDDGFDLPAKKCPNCKTNLESDGHDIMFETFLGFEGDKVPDIDLNFASEYQQKAMDYVRELFGDSHVFRAGTISTLAGKTSYGHVANYFEAIGKEINNIPSVERDLKSIGLEGIKRTTGQHPGGLIIVPKEYDVFDFTPYNYPADDTNSDWLTTHFAFESIHDNLLKIDILGHQDPSMLYQLEKVTGIKPTDIPKNDPLVIKLFTSLEPLGITSEEFHNERNGALGVPEFGTDFVRKILNETKPSSFADLVRISGLSHGTDVYVGNAQDWITNGNVLLRDVIACRDDIMVYLIKKGFEPKVAFNIMESVRKGRGLTKDQEKMMQDFKLPSWYIESCKRIKYMFPKAHATAYVYNATRIAWFKIHKPLAYYSVFFTTRLSHFDVGVMSKGLEAVRSEQQRLKAIIKPSTKEHEIMETLEISTEMMLRGFKVANIDIAKSDATLWKIDEDGKTLIPPFIALEGLGPQNASVIVDQRKHMPFKSIKDFKERSGVNNTQFAKMETLGVFKKIFESDQINIFEMFE